jgi:hypothetical protein
MRCPVQDGSPEILLDYCARRLPTDSAAILVQHMTRCEDCRRVAEAQERVWTALDEWRALPVSDDFDDRLYARISEEERRTFWARVLGERLTWRPALSVAGVCATLALAVFLNMPDSSHLPVAEPPRMEALETEQIERAVEDMDMLRQFSTPAQQLQAI